MLTRSNLGDLNVFMILARTGGFRKAALELDVSPSTLSHALRGLETRLGVRLVNRNARSVTLTEAGEELLQRLEVGFGEIATGLEGLNRYRRSPAGRLRLNVLSDAARLRLGPALAEYGAAFPDVDLEVVVQDTMIDIVGQGFDAGIRFGGRVPEDMIALPIGAPLDWVMVASPAYLEKAGRPATPDDLVQHRCIGMRTGTGAIYRWEIGDDARQKVLDLEWTMVVSESALAIDVARAGGGIAYCLKPRIDERLRTGELEVVLPEWTSQGEPFHIYYSSRRQQSEALKSLIALLRRQPAAEGM